MSNPLHLRTHWRSFAVEMLLHLVARPSPALRRCLERLPDGRLARALERAEQTTNDRTERNAI